MWAFLITEVMFFGGMFTAYAYYRYRYPAAFAAGSAHLDVTLGTINTAVLIGSSLTMVLAVHAAQLGRNRDIVRFFLMTIGLGLVFLVIKAFEYGHKWRDHLVPGRHFRWHGDGGGGPVQLFYSLYFAMTGMHALHMVIGMALIGVLAVMAGRGRFTPQNHNAVENIGLYWHFVDVIWIFLFPLLYLLGVHT
ncbi:MAG: cytochrome c oxidase subunit 3 [Phycisphaerae bacterium]